MNNRREINLANQAALVPLFGGMDKKPRPLDRDVITIGRARGCDIGLVAADISTLHCLIFRGAEGFKVRDCGSRTGTRVNGDLPRNKVLADGDVLQLGPFSFTVKIPAGARVDPRWADAGRFEHCQRSRRNLVQLALHLRRQLHQKRIEPGDKSSTALNRKATDLRSRIHQYDQRLNQLELAERDLETDREQLLREREGHQAHVQKVEGDLSKRLEQADQEIHVRWQEFQQRCVAEEGRLAEGAKEAKHHERQDLLDREAAIEREKDALAVRAQQFKQGVEDWQRQREETMNSNENWVAEQAETISLLEKQRAALSQAEAGLREQRTELGRMMSDLRELQDAIKTQQGVDVLALTQENEELRRGLAEYESRLAEAADKPSPEPSKESEELKCENELLKQLLQEKDGYLDELKAQVEGLKNNPKASADAPTPIVDLDSYEAELMKGRQQLESDRGKLNKEIEQLRFRNSELDEATREMEMAMSKERAEMGRERTRLDRMREDVRAELERAQREAVARESMASVNKLREEMSQKKGTAKEDGNKLTDRLRSYRPRLTDAPG